MSARSFDANVQQQQHRLPGAAGGPRAAPRQPGAGGARRRHHHAELYRQLEHRQLNNLNLERFSLSARASSPAPQMRVVEADRPSTADLCVVCQGLQGGRVQPRPLAARTGSTRRPVRADQRQHQRRTSSSSRPRRSIQLRGRRSSSRLHDFSRQRRRVPRGVQELPAEHLQRHASSSSRTSTACSTDLERRRPGQFSVATGTCTSGKIKPGVISQGAETRGGVLPGEATSPISIGYTFSGHASYQKQPRVVSTRRRAARSPALFLLPGSQVSNAPKNVVTTSVGLDSRRRVERA